MYYCEDTNDEDEVGLCNELILTSTTEVTLKMMKLKMFVMSSVTVETRVTINVYINIYYKYICDARIYHTVTCTHTHTGYTV